jgi:hypothetical protein
MFVYCRNQKKKIKDQTDIDGGQTLSFTDIYAEKPIMHSYPLPQHSTRSKGQEWDFDEENVGNANAEDEASCESVERQWHRSLMSYSHKHSRGGSVEYVGSEQHDSQQY